jgi:hypothetical protein
MPSPCSRATSSRRSWHERHRLCRRSGWWHRLCRRPGGRAERVHAVAITGRCVAKRGTLATIAILSRTIALLAKTTSPHRQFQIYKSDPLTNKPTGAPLYVSPRRAPPSHADRDRRGQFERSRPGYTGLPSRSNQNNAGAASGFPQLQRRAQSPDDHAAAGRSYRETLTCSAPRRMSRCGTQFADDRRDRDRQFAIDVDVVKLRAAEHALELAAELLPNGREESGYWRTGSDRRRTWAEPGGDAARARQGMWCDHAASGPRAAAT